jgi:nucleotide-binding universal stress UspA family protein
MGCLMLVLSPTRHNPRSVDLAISLVEKTGRPLLAVFVVDTKVTDAMSGRIVDAGFLGDRVSAQLQAAIEREYEDRGRRELEEVKARAEKIGIECEVAIRRGDFVEECLKIARQKRVEDMVVSRAERSKLSRKLFGSAVNELVGKAPCPVLVVSDSAVEHPRRTTPPGSGLAF